jgi:hypothetical protein
MPGRPREKRVSPLIFRHHRSFFLLCSVMFSLVCCARTSLDTADVGPGGTMPLGGAVAGGGALAGSGGTLAAGGVTGTGGSTATSDGSATTDLDSCSSDADCLSSCIWVTAPTDSSHCTAFYCCGMTWLSKKRCDANQAAWAFHCPNQSPQLMVCPCVELCLGDVFSCVAGQCTDWCPPRVDASMR